MTFAVALTAPFARVRSRTIATGLALVGTASSSARWAKPPLLARPFSHI